ncbi:zf-HC2 domain-containing protein [Pedobacter sp. MR2016-19]|uniref:zf-HC2 domain-containing protein n=1 Tax=Pedobacter sp. MR2016-19 TaxID=2780089 RepID=UPI001875E268|nr:zf-HC2 domain-containing protein [Pedobacter sp. MR2016-19]MBE5318573.1 zf-HC2 domain-containing protein [Pedobacter sp. MR2016-19]
MTSALKNIIYNCKQATFLIEKRIAGKITAAEKLQLHVHLKGCSVCKIYQQQSILINKVFVGFENSDFKLDETFKKTLKDKIEKEINKN